MEKERYKELSEDKYAYLTSSEVDQGWHFCRDWDFMLVGPEMKPELETCTCIYSQM